MSHCLEAIIGKTEYITPLADDWICAKSIELGHGFSMIKISTELLDDINELINKQGAVPFTEFNLLSKSLDELLRISSVQKKLAYVETEYFGGCGTQAAILYENGNPVIGPLQTEDVWDSNSEEYLKTQSKNSAINLVLKSLGVLRNEKQDEFDFLKLELYR